MGVVEKVHFVKLPSPYRPYFLDPHGMYIIVFNNR